MDLTSLIALAGGSLPALPSLDTPAVPGNSGSDPDFRVLIESLLPADAAAEDLDKALPKETPAAAEAPAALPDIAVTLASLPATPIPIAEAPKPLPVFESAEDAIGKGAPEPAAVASPATTALPSADIPDTAAAPSPAPVPVPDLAAAPSAVALPHRIEAPVHAPAVATVHAPVASAPWRDELGAQIVVFAREGVQHAELRLDPPDLGPIEVRLNLDRETKELAVHFVASHPATREALEQALPRLRETMLDGGFSLGDASVAREGSSEGENFSEGRGKPLREDREALPAPQPRSLPDRLIDTFA